MSLNTKNKRGSAMLVEMPFRPWIADPAGSSSPEQRMSFLHYVAANVAIFAILQFSLLSRLAQFTLAARQPQLDESNGPAEFTVEGN